MSGEATPTDVTFAVMQIDRDLDGVLAVDEASFVNHWTREMFEWEAAHSDVARVFVCRAGGRDEIVAYCAVWLIFDELHINNLAVLPEWRLRGVGGALLTHVLGEAATAGAVRATLEVRSSNEPAIALYRRFGFVERGRRPRYYTNPVEDALILWREPAASPLETPRNE